DQRVLGLSLLQLHRADADLEAGQDEIAILHIVRQERQDELVNRQQLVLILGFLGRCDEALRVYEQYLALIRARDVLFLVLGVLQPIRVVASHPAQLWVESKRRTLEMIRPHFADCVEQTPLLSVQTDARGQLSDLARRREENALYERIGVFLLAPPEA